MTSFKKIIFSALIVTSLIHSMEDPRNYEGFYLPQPSNEITWEQDLDRVEGMWKNTALHTEANKIEGWNPSFKQKIKIIKNYCIDWNAAKAVGDYINANKDYIDQAQKDNAELENVYDSSGLRPEKNNVYSTPHNIKKYGFSVLLTGGSLFLFYRAYKNVCKDKKQKRHIKTGLLQATGATMMLIGVIILLQKNHVYRSSNYIFNIEGYN